MKITILFACLALMLAGTASAQISSDPPTRPP